MEKEAKKPFIPAPLPVKIEYDADLQRRLSAVERALGRFDGLLSVLPNPDLLLAPLVRREAVSSAQIEGSLSTISDAMRFEADNDFASPEKRDDVREIVNYHHALSEAEKKLKEGFSFDLWMLRGLHGDLLGGSVRGGDKEPGNFRSRQNWIGAPGALMGDATHIPPPPEKIAELMENWLTYWRADAPSPLVQMAVLHGQFEVIHPFMDGNGRIGRLLLPLFLSEKKVLSQPVFYLSGRLAVRREEYQKGLQNIDAHPGKWREWVAFFLDICAEQAEENINISRAILELHKELAREAENLLHSRYAAGLVDAVFMRPVFTASGLHFSGEQPSRLTLDKMIKKLAAKNILTLARAGRRGKPAFYMLPRLLELLEQKQ